MSFAAVTAVEEYADGRFRADISADWTIGGRPNGGYLLALLGRAATTRGTHAHVLAASAHYLSAPSPGSADIVVEPLRVGRAASQLRVRLDQDDRTCVEALFTTGELTEAAPQWQREELPTEVAPRESCIRVPGTTPTGMRVPIMDQVDLRLDPAVTGFARGRPSGRGELRGWLALPGADLDPIALLYAVDAFPPATFEIEVTDWVPTLELTCYVRALPTRGAVQIVHRATVLGDQRVDETTVVRDAGGRIVAQATQLAGIRLRADRG